MPSDLGARIQRGQDGFTLAAEPDLSLGQGQFPGQIGRHRAEFRDNPRQGALKGESRFDAQRHEVKRVRQCGDHTLLTAAIQLAQAGFGAPGRR